MATPVHTMTLSRPALRVTAIVLLASAAWATPATPPSLEALVRDATWIVVARLKTQPRHVDDLYEIEIEETLKGNAPPVRVRAPDYFRGCCIPLNAPPAPALEAEARRVLLFLDEDGVRQVVILDPEETVSAWFIGGHAASHMPGAVRALVEIQAADARRAAELWVGGLRGQNPLLVDALLDRATAAVSRFGSEYGPLDRARRDLNAAREEILAAAIEHCGSRSVSARYRAFGCALSLKEEPVLLEKALAAARAAPRANDGSINLLLATDDPAAPKAVIDALGAGYDGELALIVPVALAEKLLIRHPECKDEVLSALVKLLDAWEAPAVAGLKRITGEKLETAAEWKEWWAAHRR